MSNPFDALGGMGGLLAGFQQQIQNAQQQAQEAEFEGKAGGGLVTAVCNGKMEVLSLSISDEAYEDKEMLEDLVIAAVNDGFRQAQANLSAQLSKITEGLPIPPGLLGM
ncbi:MAG: YbaB/EbfC family nucleoid-associated protein [Myxococcota bacterium]